jgi:uncharacterized membrane protein
MNGLKQMSTHLLQMLRHVGEILRRRKFLWLLVLVVTALYSSLSILRHTHFISSAYDLGIFDQAIWKYSRFQAPIVTVRANFLNENILGDHFHPIIMLLAPLYWFADGVEVLLVAQALLLAIAVVPIFLFTEKRLGKVAAYLFALSYSLFWGIQRVVEFDFHEIAFAVPLVALAIYFIDEERWMAYFVCLVLLLLTKENLSAMTFFFGVYLLAIRQYKRGLISMGASVAWFFAVTKVFIPYFNGSVRPRWSDIGRYYRYWSFNQLGPDPLSALVAVIKNPLLLIRTLFSPGVKLQTYWYIFHPFLFLAFFSPLFILAIPLIAERFLSEMPHFWTTEHHYTAVIAPVLVMASVDSLARITRRIKKVKSSYLIIPVACLVLALNLRLLPQFPLWNLTSAQYWRLSPSDAVGRKAISLIPPTASVIAQGPITPHLSHRRVLFLLDPLLNTPDADFIIACERISPFPALGYPEVRDYLDSQQARGYRKIFEEDGWIVLKAESPPRLYRDAAFVEQSVPDEMTAGQTYDVHVTMKNTGLNTWTAGEHYRLAFYGGTLLWGIQRVELSSTVETDAPVKFDFRVTAPTEPGTYSFRWIMIQDGVMEFGAPSSEILVKVTAASSPE